jgi:hypothetical protein
VSVMGECDLDVMGVPSKFSVIRKDVVLARMLPPHDLNCEENTVCRKWNCPRSWTVTVFLKRKLNPEVSKKRSVSR